MCLFGETLNDLYGAAWLGQQWSVQQWSVQQRLHGTAEVSVTSGVLYGAAMVQQWSVWWAMCCMVQQYSAAVVGTTVCAQQQLGPQQWMLPVRSVVRRTVRGSVSVR